MTIGSLFSGIGGLELGLEWAGLGPVRWQVEIESGRRAVLARHWPDARRYDDVRRVGAHNLEPVEILCGGFPCQDVAQAARGRNPGLDGARSGLWIEFARIAAELSPRVVVVENVWNGHKRWLPTVRRTLHLLGYRSRAFGLSSAQLGAPHDRRRVFVVAHAKGSRSAARIRPITSAHWGTTASPSHRSRDGCVARRDLDDVGAKLSHRLEEIGAP